MDLGITNRNAIVCGGSSGLGKAIVEALHHEGVDVLMVARDEEKLVHCAQALESSSGRRPQYLSVDLSDSTSRVQLAERCRSADILVNNSGGPPVGNYLQFTHDDWLAALESNMLSAIELINAALPGMIERKFGRILNITSHMVKAPMAPLSLSNGARAGLTGYVSGVAKDVAKHNVTLNNLLPGQFDTARLQANHEHFAAIRGVSVDTLQTQLRGDIPAGRFGRAEEFGAYAAFLCSQHCGFVTGQNILLDGGQYPGLI